MSCRRRRPVCFAPGARCREPTRGQFRPAVGRGGLTPPRPAAQAAGRQRGEPKSGSRREELGGSPPRLAGGAAPAGGWNPPPPQCVTGAAAAGPLPPRPQRRRRGGSRGRPPPGRRAGARLGGVSARTLRLPWGCPAVSGRATSRGGRAAEGAAPEPERPGARARGRLPRLPAWWASAWRDPPTAAARRSPLALPICPAREPRPQTWTGHPPPCRAGWWGPGRTPRGGAVPASAPPCPLWSSGGGGAAPRSRPRGLSGGL